MEYAFGDRIAGIVQVDRHSQLISDTDLDTFGESPQLRLGLGFAELIGGHWRYLFLSKNIAVGTAPDIIMVARLVHQF